MSVLSSQQTVSTPRVCQCLILSKTHLPTALFENHGELTKLSSSGSPGVFCKSEAGKANCCALFCSKLVPTELRRPWRSILVFITRAGRICVVFQSSSCHTLSETRVAFEAVRSEVRTQKVAPQLFARVKSSSAMIIDKDGMHCKVCGCSPHFNPPTQ